MCFAFSTYPSTLAFDPITKFLALFTFGQNPGSVLTNFLKMRFSHCIALVGGFCIAVDAVPMSKSNNNLAMHGLKPNATDTAILHEWIMKQKEEQFAENEHWGEFDFDNYKSYGAEQCIEGKAGEFMCKNIDMSGYLRHQDMGSMIRAGNDIWGKSHQWHL